MLKEKTTNLSASRVCLFLLSALCDFHCVERVAVFCWLSCAASSFRCFCGSSWRSRSALKKSASVVAKASALMVTVLTYFSSASFFVRASLMVPLKIVSASAASWHFSHVRPSPPLA